MSKKKRELSEDEQALWRRVARSVKTRKKIAESEPGAPALPSTSSGKRPQPTGADKKGRVPEPVPEAVSGRARANAAKPPPPPKPADRGSEKRVRRGKLEIDAKLDLHGYTQDGAYTALATFLHSAQRRNARVALVVTGVGRGGGGVLKLRLPDWLAARELKPLISGYAQAHRAHGGAGAYYVFVKRRD